jgi:hypothetical protein
MTWLRTPGIAYPAGGRYGATCIQSPVPADVSWTLALCEFQSANVV